MTFLPIAVFWLLAIWAVLGRGPGLLYLFFGSMGFGAFAVLPPQITGGLTFTATPIVSLLIVARAFLSRSGPGFFLKSAFSLSQLGLLFMFWATAIVASMFMPRLFEDAVMVVPVRGELDTTIALEPSAQNVSQLVYISISILTVFAFARVLRTPADRQLALKAMVFGGAMMVLTGFVDFLGQYVPLEPVLSVFRTATYALAVDVEVLGAKRVVGLMPEASAFGSTSLAFLSMLVFFRRAIADRRVRVVYAPVVIGLLALFCYLSTSSATYVGLAVLGLVIAAEAMLRAFSGGRGRSLYRQDLVGELSVVLSLVVVVGLLVIVRPAVIEPVFELVDKMVLQKTSSSSFEERGMWRTVALETLAATGGLGVGLGGTRASSHFVAIFAGTGILGGLLYFSFVLQSLLRRSTHMDWEGQFILAAFRFSFLPSFVVDLLVAEADFGAMMAFGFGIVTATAIANSPGRTRRPIPPQRARAGPDRAGTGGGGPARAGPAPPRLASR